MWVVARADQHLFIFPAAINLSVGTPAITEVSRSYAGELALRHAELARPAIVSYVELTGDTPTEASYPASIHLTYASCVFGPIIVLVRQSGLVPPYRFDRYDRQTVGDV